MLFENFEKNPSAFLHNPCLINCQNKNYKNNKTRLKKLSYSQTFVYVFVRHIILF